jgi:hypothetical protein
VFDPTNRLYCAAQAIAICAKHYACAPHIGDRLVPRDTGYTQDIQVADLLHDVAEDTACTIDDVRVKFAEHIGRQVADLTEDAAIDSTTSASARCAIRSRLPHRRRSTSRWPTRSPHSTTPR